MEKFKITLAITILLVFSFSCTRSKNDLKREELKNMSEGKSEIKEIKDFESVKIDNNIWMTKNLNVSPKSSKSYYLPLNLNPIKKIPKNFQIFYNRNKKIIILARPIKYVCFK